MSDDELFDMFGLDDSLPSEPDPVPSLHTPRATVAHPNVVQMDDWGRRRGRELADCPRWTATGLPVECAQDFHALAFEPSPVLQSSTAAYREKYIRAMVETPDYAALHAKTMYDDYASQLAALEMGDKFAEFKRESEDRDHDATAAGKPKPDGDEMRIMLAAAEGVKAALAEVELAEEASRGLGAGTPGERLDPAKLAGIFSRVRTDPTLRRICEAAGRYRRVAQSKQRMKTTHGHDEMVGVEMGGDLGRMVPSELVKLDVEKLELDMLRRISERQVMQREMAASEPAGKGPIIVVVDESGSMHGKPIETAKALALGLAWVARQQKRWIGLVAYSGNSGQRVISLPPGRWDESGLMDWLVQFIGGGSCRDVPIVELPGIYDSLRAPVGQTDVIMLTDAICNLPYLMVTAFNAWRKEVKAKVTTVVIGDRAGDLLKVSDECHEVTGIDADSPVVGSLLSL